MVVYIYMLYYTIFDKLSVNWAIHNGLRKVLVDCHGPLARIRILSRYWLDMQKDVVADFGHVVSTPHVYCHFLPDWWLFLTCKYVNVYHSPSLMSLREKTCVIVVNILWTPTLKSKIEDQNCQLFLTKQATLANKLYTITKFRRQIVFCRLVAPGREGRT